MKPTIKKTFAVLAITLLSQPIVATSTISSGPCYVSENEKSSTIDVSKFTAVWLKVNKNNNSINSQAHLQEYLENALEANQGTLDVRKFAAIWNKTGNKLGQAHLKKSLVELVANASKSEACSHN